MSYSAGSFSCLSPGIFCNWRPARQFRWSWWSVRSFSDPISTESTAFPYPAIPLSRLPQDVCSLSLPVCAVHSVVSEPKNDRIDYHFFLTACQAMSYSAGFLLLPLTRHFLQLASCSAVSLQLVVLSVVFQPKNDRIDCHFLCWGGVGHYSLFLTSDWLWLSLSTVFLSLFMGEIGPIIGLWHMAQDFYNFPAV